VNRALGAARSTSRARQKPATEIPKYQWQIRGDGTRSGDAYGPNRTRSLPSIPTGTKCHSIVLQGAVSCGLSCPEHCHPKGHVVLVVSKEPAPRGQPCLTRNCIKVYWLFAKLAVSSGAPRLPHKDLCSFFGKAGLEAQRRSCGGDCLPFTDLLKLSTMIPLNGSEPDIKDLLLLAAKPYGDF